MILLVGINFIKRTIVRHSKTWSLVAWKGGRMEGVFNKEIVLTELVGPKRKAAITKWPRSCLRIRDCQHAFICGNYMPQIPKLLHERDRLFWCSIVYLLLFKTVTLALQRRSEPKISGSIAGRGRKVEEVFPRPIVSLWVGLRRFRYLSSSLRSSSVAKPAVTIQFQQ